MSDTDRITNLEARVGRLETTMSQHAANLTFSPVVDPAGPWGGGGGGHVPVHLPVGDPPPIDVSRFSAAQLQSSLHSINAEKTRLTAMEGLINQHLNKTK
jgi:hypothetical protein